MGKLVVTEFITLDGVIEEPRWSFEFDRGEDGEAFKGEELRAAEAQLLGRITYQGFAQAWPTMEGTGWFGEKMNAMPKYVVSTTMSDADATWNNSTVIRDGVPDRVAELKERSTGDILVAGSSQLVRTLAEHDLVDEYRLMVFPFVAGGGKRLFGDGFPSTRLALVERREVGPDHIAIDIYRPAGRA